MTDARYARYARNQAAITEEEQLLLGRKRVVIVGCGGLGGYALENLTRVGVGFIRVVDGDTFEESNLNRQLLCSTLNLDKPKVLAAQQRARAVNPLVVVEPVQQYLDEHNAFKLLQDCDLAIDALDSIPARFLLQRAAAEANIPLVHGAVAGWRGQVCLIRPGENLLDLLYPSQGAPRGEEQEEGCLAFTAALVGALQAAEAVRALLGRPGLSRELLVADLLAGEFTRVGLGG